MYNYIGQLMLFGGNFAPKGWALCNGQLLSIANNSALFSILGTTYGGDGITTFALPDLRGRAPIHFGQGPGLSNYQQGQMGGYESVTLTSANLPSHNHVIAAHSGTGNAESPASAYPAAYGSASPPSGPWATGSPDTTMSASAVLPTGSNYPVDTLSPYLTLNWVIALEGIYPSQG